MRWRGALAGLLLALAVAACGPAADLGSAGADRGPAPSPERAAGDDARERDAAGPAVPSGLDCGGDRWAVQPGFAADAVGTGTPAEALARTLDPYAERLGGGVHLRGGVGVVEVDDRVVVRAAALELPNGTWVVDLTEGCGDVTTPGG